MFKALVGRPNEFKFSLHLLYEDMSSLVVSREFLVKFNSKNNEVNLTPYGILYHNCQVPAADDFKDLINSLSSKYARFATLPKYENA